MNRYLIDGNNLIWKIPELKKFQKNEKERALAREKLIFKLQRFFAGKKIKVTVFFDGAPHAKLGGGIELKYSYERKADELIREAIDASKSKRAVTVVSSDRWIYDYVKINGCNAVMSEEFARTLENKDDGEGEDDIIRNLRDEDWEKIFE